MDTLVINQGEDTMKRVISVLVVAMLLTPMALMTGCACQDSGRMHQEHGGK